MRFTEIKMQFFLSLYVFFCAAFPFAQAGSEIQDLMKRAAKKDKAAFATDYLHAVFSAWQNRFSLESFRVDSVFAKGGYEEIWLTPTEPAPSSKPGLALLVSWPPARKIVEVRRLLLTEREKLQPVENEVVEFVERLAWIYETGDESFMQDFLYPSYVKLRYVGLTNSNEILPRLRAKFKDILPIQSLGWEGRSYMYAIRLVLDSPLQPLEISVDIQKHLTANFFELADQSERVQTLNDSLRVWLAEKRVIDAGKNLAVTAQTPPEAIAQVLARHFKDYDLAVLDSAATSATITATLPAMEQLRPESVRFRLEASRAGAEAYSIRPVWLAAGATESSSLKKTAGRNAELVGVVDEAIQRYSTLDLPPAFQPEFGLARNADGNLVLHHRQADSIQWRGAAPFQNVLRGLTRDKRAYFFLQGSTKSARRITVTGYAIWRDNKRLWQHVAKINEAYFFTNRKYQLNKVTIDLYPFIRLENVRSLFAEPDTSARREKIIIGK
jgi:hypothetical protein